MKQTSTLFKLSKFIPLIILLAVMQWAVGSGRVSPLYLASPTQFLRDLWNMISTGAVFEHIWTTLLEFFVGLGTSVLLGVVLGVLVATLPKLEDFTRPYFSAIMAIPKVSLMPLLTIWFGIGLLSKGIMIFLFSFFSVFYNTITGIKQTPPSYLKVARVFETSRIQTVWKILLPSALPTIFAGIRVAAGVSFVGAIFSEMLASKNGLGNLLTQSSQLYKTGEVFAIILLITILSTFMIHLIDFIEKRVFLRWKYKNVSK